NAGVKNPRTIPSRRNMTSQQTTQAKTSKAGNGANGSSAGQAKRPGQAGNGTGTQSAKQSANTGAGQQTAQGKQASGQKKKGGAKRVRKVDPIELVLSRAELFHDLEGRPYASIKINSHVETRAMESKPFRHWFKCAYFEEANAPIHGEE